MNDFLTEEIELSGIDLTKSESEAVTEIVYDALRGQGIDVSSFSWGIQVEYLGNE
jgi:hypothetical protein